jgi:hypothetical protein
MHQTALALPKQLLDGFDKLARQQGVTRGEIMAPASYGSPRRAQGISKVRAQDQANGACLGMG